MLDNTFHRWMKGVTWQGSILNGVYNDRLFLIIKFIQICISCRPKIYFVLKLETVLRTKTNLILFCSNKIISSRSKVCFIWRLEAIPRTKTNLILFCSNKITYFSPIKSLFHLEIGNNSKNQNKFNSIPIK